jgi:hypothetical protein
MGPRRRSGGARGGGAGWRGGGLRVTAWSARGRVTERDPRAGALLRTRRGRCGERLGKRGATAGYARLCKSWAQGAELESLALPHGCFYMTCYAGPHGLRRFAGGGRHADGHAGGARRGRADVACALARPNGPAAPVTRCPALLCGWVCGCSRDEGVPSRRAGLCGGGVRRGMAGGGGRRSGLGRVGCAGWWAGRASGSDDGLSICIRCCCGSGAGSDKQRGRSHGRRGWMGAGRRGGGGRGGGRGGRRGAGGGGAVPPFHGGRAALCGSFAATRSVARRRQRPLRRAAHARVGVAAPYRRAAAPAQRPTVVATTASRYGHVPRRPCRHARLVCAHA